MGGAGPAMEGSRRIDERPFPQDPRLHRLRRGHRPRGPPPRHYGPGRDTESIPGVYPLGLGVIGVSPLEMARAFSVFANQGREVTPISILSIEDRNGRVILEPEKDLRTQQKKKYRPSRSSVRRTRPSWSTCSARSSNTETRGMDERRHLFHLYRRAGKEIHETGGRQDRHD